MRLAALAAVAGAVAAAAPAKPNIIVLLTDDQDLTLGSLDAGVMPNVQRVARDGLTFQQSFVNSPICCPSRTSTLSGLYPHNLGDQALGWCGDFRSRENSTWVQALSAAGYRTGLFGKYYNTYTDYCFSNVHVPAGWERWYAMCSDSVYFGNDISDQGNMTALKDGEYLTAAIGNASLAWLQEVVTGDDPFFAYIAPHAPHVPATPAPWVWGTPLPSYIAPRLPNWNASSPDKQWTVAGLPAMDGVITQYSDELYVRRLLCLISVDDILRDVLALLEQSGQLNNTFIVFSSDHGYNLGNFRLPSGKFHPYENDVRVPLIVTGPDIPAGSVSDAMAANVDLGPTFLELAGLPVPATYDGRSLVPAMLPSASLQSAPLVAGADAAAPPVVPTPAGWRESLLIEYYSMGYIWRGPCTNGSAPCPNGPEALLDTPGNTWVALRVQNATDNTMYVEFRDRNVPATPGATNWTEIYDVNNDPFQLRNLRGQLPNATVEALAAQLWGVVNCKGVACST